MCAKLGWTIAARGLRVCMPCRCSMRQVSSAGCDSCACAVTDSCSEVTNIVLSTSGIVHLPMHIQTRSFERHSLRLRRPFAWSIQADHVLYHLCCIEACKYIPCTAPIGVRLMRLCRAISAQALAAAAKPTQQTCAAGLAATPSSLPSRWVSASMLKR